MESIQIIDRKLEMQIPLVFGLFVVNNFQAQAIVDNEGVVQIASMRMPDERFLVRTTYCYTVSFELH